MTDIPALWASLVIDPHVRSDVVRRARRILASRARYEPTSRAAGVPWFVIALIYDLEADGDPRKLLTGARQDGGTDFDREAVAALRARGVTGPWHDIPAVARALETWNGLDYRVRGIHSPYLWAGTNHYDAGLYVGDGVWSPKAIPARPGGMAVLRAMLDLDPSSIDIDDQRPLPTGWARATTKRVSIMSKIDPAAVLGAATGKAIQALKAAPGRLWAEIAAFVLSFRVWLAVAAAVATTIAYVAPDAAELSALRAGNAALEAKVKTAEDAGRAAAAKATEQSAKAAHLEAALQAEMTKNTPPPAVEANRKPRRKATAKAASPWPF